MNSIAGLHQLAFCLLAALFIGCGEDPLPKPRGYFRIETPPATYTPYILPCGPQFEVPSHAKIELIALDSPDQACWYNLVFPSFSAKLHCTLIRLRDPRRLHVFGGRSTSDGLQPRIENFRHSDPCIRSSREPGERTGFRFGRTGGIALAIFCFRQYNPFFTWVPVFPARSKSRQHRSRIGLCACKTLFT